MAASGIGLVASIASNAGISALRNVANQTVKNKGFNNFSGGSLLLDTVGGALSGGKGMGNYAKLGTLNHQLTRKVFSGSVKTATKGIKYYASQTKYAYNKYIIRPAKRSLILGLISNGGRYLYKQWKH